MTTYNMKGERQDDTKCESILTPREDKEREGNQEKRALMEDGSNNFHWA